MIVYDFTTCKYNKSIEFSQRCIDPVVDDLSDLLNIQYIKYKEYNKYSPHRKLNHLYLIYDVMDLNATKNFARWSLIKIIARGNIVVMLDACTTIKHAHAGHAALGPLYIEGKLVYEYPTTDLIYSNIHSYITQHILPELEECLIVEHQS